MSVSKETAKYEICFFRQSTKEDTSSKDNLQLAFEAMDSHQLEPAWITEEQALKVTKKEPKLYVMDPFEGNVFEHLKSIDCRIIGPLCILSCLQSDEMLPKRPHPIYSVSMRKITVSCSNINNSSRENICKKIELMSGLFSKDLTKSVSHLVVGEVGSKKYQVAANFGLPIMTPEWIEDIWQNGQYKQLHASDAYYNKFKCPVFKGLVITVSQLSAEERRTIQTIIQENGGKYLAPLKSRETTHLVLAEPVGDKYRYAKTWKVFCVNVNWVYESVKAGYCKDESLFKIDESTKPIHVKRSTPNKDLTSLDLPVIDCSAITNASVITHLDESLKSDVSFQVNNKNSSLFSSLEVFDLSTLPKNGQYLDGCKIFLTGFCSNHLDKLRKIVNAGGGIRFCKYTESLSHVVCGELTEDFLQSLKSSSIKPFVVNLGWLLECCKQETLVDEKPFLCMEVTLLSPEKQEPEIKVPFNQSSKLPSRTESIVPDYITSIFREYVPNKIPSEKDDSRKAEDFKKSAKQNESKDENEPHNAYVPIENVDINPQAESTPEVDDSSVEQLFAGLNFVIFGFGDKDSDILSRMIKSHCGTVFTNDEASKANIAVVPLIWHDYKIKVPTIITNCWLQKCIEDSQIYDFDENELFQPVQIIPGKKPFQSFVISVSQYTGTERDCLMHLAEVLGAVCQEYFVRKANKSRGILSNTHLIVAFPEGRKYEVAKKWKIPAVNKQWVLDAARYGSPPPVEGYLFEPCEPPLPPNVLTSTVPSDVPKGNLNHGISATVPIHCPSNLTAQNMSDVHVENKAEMKKETPNPDNTTSQKHTSNIYVENEVDLNMHTPSVSNKTSRRSMSNAHSEKKLDLEANIANSCDVTLLQKGSYTHMENEQETNFNTSNPSLETPNRNTFNIHVKNKLEEKIQTPSPRISTPQHGTAELNKQSELKTDDNILDSNYITPHRSVTKLKTSDKHNKTISPILPKGETSMNDTLNLDQSLKLKFCVSGLLNDLDNSAKQEQSFIKSVKRQSLPIEELFSRNLASGMRAINKNMKFHDDSKLDCENNSLNETLYQPKSNGIFKGVILYVSKKLNNIQNDLNEIVSSLGGEYLWSYDSTCTHFVFTGKTNDLSKEFREAKNQGKKIVCPEWIYTCKEKNELLDEGSFPHTLKLNMTLTDEISIVKTATENTVPGQNKASSIVNDKKISGKDYSLKPEQSLSPLNDPTHEVYNVADFNQQLNDLLVAAAKSTRRRHSRRLINSVSSSPSNEISPIHKLQKQLSSSFIQPDKQEENATGDTGEMQDTCSQQSQPYPVVWDDPTGRLEREKIAAAAALANAVKVKKFMFTNIPDPKKLEHIKIIRDLGGEVSDEKTFDVTATHLILQKPIKNEKFLASVASGKWIIHPQYLSASQKQGKFVSEEEYEWGGPCTNEFLSGLPNSIKKIALCPFRWRIKLHENKGICGAFDNWFVAVIAGDSAKLCTYTKILEAGGALVVSLETADAVLDKITHIIVDMKKRSLSQIDLRPYITQNIKCVKPEYLAFYLIEDPPPDIEKFIIPDTKEPMDTLDSSSKRQRLSIGSRSSKRSRVT